MANAIRRATVGDADAIAVVHMRTWQAAYRGLMPSDFLEQLDVAERAERWRRNLSSTAGDHFVMEDDAGRIVGFCSVLPSPNPHDDETIGVIAALYVDPPHWRRGFGAALMQVATARARERGFRELWLRVLEGNESARRFYENLGFQVDGSAQREAYGDAVLPVLRYRASVG